MKLDLVELSPGLMTFKLYDLGNKPPLGASLSSSKVQRSFLSHKPHWDLSTLEKTFTGEGRGHVCLVVIVILVLA